MVRPGNTILFGVALGFVCPFYSWSFVPSLKASCINSVFRRSRTSFLKAEKDDGNGGMSKSGGYKFGDLFLKKAAKGLSGKDDYEFGDITKSIGKKITNSENYEFGDISRWLDARAKSAVSDATGKDEYEFGDLTRYLDERAKSTTSEFTTKDEYVVGDISKELVRRVSSGEYQSKDIILLCKVLSSFGVATFSPVAGLLPVTLLLKMFNYSIEMEIGGRLMEGLAEALDRRFKEAITGDSNYQIGDLTKKSIMNFVGKDSQNDSYEFGDFSKTVARNLENSNSVNNNRKLKPFGETDSEEAYITANGEPVLEQKLVAELEQWDTMREKKSGFS